MTPFIGGYAALEGNEVLVQETSCWTWILPLDWFLTRVPVEHVSAYYVHPEPGADWADPGRLRLNYGADPWLERWCAVDQYVVEDFADEVKRRRWVVRGGRP